MPRSNEVHDEVAGPVRILVMGVSGSGKSTVGAAIAAALGASFVDGDDLHPPANVAKMAGGSPLDDADREPWLDRVGETLAGGASVVVACSALKRRYRDRIRAIAPGTVTIALDGGRDLLASRLGARVDHFMPAALLDSQLAALESLAADEPGAIVPIDVTPDEVVSAALAAIRGESAPA
ncbi:gluconokinase [Agromyces sp. MMS24-K17]|uniref:gluconokinase n=1 Tax=Agromyces sp. MMS24-K17 TaxID=3372850 RepID=UPI00375423CC